MMLAGSVNTNIDALYALQALQNTDNTTSNLEQQLSSGLAINSPSDNPAGYIAAQGFTTQLGGVTQAISNANQAISLLETANGAITQQVNVLQSISTTANQAANGLNSAQQLQSLQSVVSELQSEITTIAQQTIFGGLNLLNGSLNGVQFQVGALEGQTIQLSVPSTVATQLGANQSSASAAATGVYKTHGVGTGGVGDVTGSSYAITSGGTGAFTAGSFAVSGSAGTASITVTAPEAASDVAASINASTASTNVTAVGNTSVAFTVTSGSVAFVLGNGAGTAAAQTNAVDISATISSVSQSGLQSLVQAINQETGTTGVTATVNSSNQLVLSQSQGENISITGFAGTGTLKAGGTTAITLEKSGGATSATVQGLVTLQSNNTFALSANAKDVGLNTNSALTTLASQNVSTISGANAAINVVTFALQQLENIGAQLGAVEQQLQATASNLQTTQTNVTTARSTVQDANIPQVTTNLTQAEILQQAGVSALAQSQTLAQSFLKLLQ
jgi:flagellin